MFGFLDDAFHREKRIALTADSNAMVEELLVSDYGEHNMLVYPNRRSFRQLYSKYCRSIILEKITNRSEKEMILIISYYDTISNVINVLKHMGIDLDGGFSREPIVIMDSVTAYSCSTLDQRSDRVDRCQRNGNTIDTTIWAPGELLGDSYASFPISYKPYRIMPLISSLIERIHDSGMNGLCVIADMGSFYLLNRIEELVDYECSYGPKFNMLLNIKAFCCHHRQDVKKTLTEEQQSRIFGNHNRNLLLTSS